MNTFHVLLVILTNSAVTNDLYPLGARGVLGYGLGSPSDAPPNTSLVGTFLPWVTFQVHAGLVSSDGDNQLKLFTRCLWH